MKQTKKTVAPVTPHTDKEEKLKALETAISQLEKNFGQGGREAPV